MDIQTLRIAVTVAAFVLFVGIWLWAFSPRHRARFEEAGRIPLDDDCPRADRGGGR